MEWESKKEFIDNLIKSLKNRTIKELITWDYYENIPEDTNNIFDIMNKDRFNYNQDELLERLEQYKISIDKSAYCQIPYGKKNTKYIRVSLIFYEKEDKSFIIGLICDRESKDTFVTIAESDEYNEIYNLYEIISIRTEKEFKILEEWMKEIEDDTESDNNQ